MVSLSAMLRPLIWVQPWVWCGFSEVAKKFCWQIGKISYWYCYTLLYDVIWCNMYIMKVCGCPTNLFKVVSKKSNRNYSIFSEWFVQTIPRCAEVCQRRWSPLVGLALTLTARRPGDPGQDWVPQKWMVIQYLRWKKTHVVTQALNVKN